MTIIRRYRSLMAVWLSVGLLLSFSSAACADSNLLTQIKQRGGLKVGIEGTYPPFSFQDEKGQLTGFETEFAQQLAQHLGVKASFQLMKWDGLLAALDSKRIDVVINQVTVSKERAQKYALSVPYTVSGIQALTLKDKANQITQADSLIGKKVGVGLGTSYEQWLRENIRGVEIRTYDDDPTKYQDLRFHRLDAILVDRLAALDLVKKSGNKMALAGPAFSRQEAAVALRKGNPELLSAINKAILLMQKDGSLHKLSTQWFGQDIDK